MSQLNINMTPEFEKLLRKYMEMNKIQHKSEAIRRAIEQGVYSPQNKASFRKLIGAALEAPLNPSPKFSSDEEIWKED